MKSSKKRSYRKLFKRIGRLVLLITGGLVLICYTLWLRAPEYVNSKIVPELGKKAGLPSLRFKVRHLGIGKADLVDFSVANGSISADSIRIDYHPLCYVTKKYLTHKQYSNQWSCGRLQNKTMDTLKFVISICKSLLTVSEQEKQQKRKARSLKKVHPKS